MATTYAQRREAAMQEEYLHYADADALWAEDADRFWELFAEFCAEVEGCHDCDHPDDLKPLGEYEACMRYVENHWFRD